MVAAVPAFTSSVWVLLNAHESPCRPTVSFDLQQHPKQIIQTKAFVRSSLLDNLSALLTFDWAIQFLILDF